MKKAITLILLVILVAGGGWFGYAAWSDNKEPATTKKSEESQNSGNENDAEVAAKEGKQPQEKAQEKSPEPKDEEIEKPTQPNKEEKSPGVEAEKGEEKSPKVEADEEEKSPEAEVEKEEPQTQPEKQDLNSTWSLHFPGSTGILAISNATPDSFDFALDIATGDDPGEIDGTATIEGNSAKFIDSEFNTGCVLTFSLNGESIDISQGNGCEQFHGQATSFEGTYYKD